MHSRSLRFGTSRGSGTGLSLVGPTKVKARKFLLLEIKKTWLILLSH